MNTRINNLRASTSENNPPARIRFEELLPKNTNVTGITDHRMVRRSIRFIAQNFCRPIQVADMASASGMSRRGFLKAFRKHVGLNPGKILRHARIEYAKRLLTEHDLPLRSIAGECGYRSQNTFCVAFQRTTGMSPKQFQRQTWLDTWRNYSRLKKATVGQ